MVLPATLSEAELARRLAGTDAAAIVKLGRHFAKVHRVLDALGLLDRACYVERATLPNQRVVPLGSVNAANVPYFSMALIRRHQLVPDSPVRRGKTEKRAESAR